VTAPLTGFAYLDEVAGEPGGVLAFAHRGGAYHPEIEGLENTLAAFKHAVALGYDYLETDVHVTRDGVLLAFHDAVLDRVTDRVPTSATPVEVAIFRLVPSARLADWLTRRRVAALQIPHKRGRWRIATAGLVRRAHAAGKHVHVWTIDDPDEMRELLDRGVDGLFTDRTDLLKDVLAERALWRG
jgi:glycerophosphoryl diester phosphodiesterase